MKMKDKRAEQIAAKRRHKELVKSQRRTEPSYQRDQPTLSVKPTILIVCEGENTEPSYFKQFKLTSATIKPIGEGYNTISLVNRAIELASEKEFEQVWCVFDKDDFDKTDFNNAIILAEANRIGVAYSIQAFEYWIILHFDDHQGGGLDRKEYHRKINSLLKPFKVAYEGNKGKIITSEIFEILEGVDEKYKKGRRELAIERARRNYNHLDHVDPASEESSTTVFKLVEELLKYV